MIAIKLLSIVFYIFVLLLFYEYRPSENICIKDIIVILPVLLNGNWKYWKWSVSESVSELFYFSLYK